MTDENLEVDLLDSDAGEYRCAECGEPIDEDVPVLDSQLLCFACACDAVGG